MTASSCEAYPFCRNLIVMCGIAPTVRSPSLPLPRLPFPSPLPQPRSHHANVFLVDGLLPYESLFPSIPLFMPPPSLKRSAGLARSKPNREPVFPVRTSLSWSGLPKRFRWFFEAKIVSEVNNSIMTILRQISRVETQPQTSLPV